MTKNSLNQPNVKMQTRIKTFLAIFLFTIIGPYCGLLVPSAHAFERAIWVWSMGPTIIQESKKSERADFFSFVTAPHGNSEAKITTIFMFLQTNIYTDECINNDEDCNLLDASRVREFIADAHSREIEVHLLDGHPIWALNAPHRDPADRLLKAVLNYNSQSATEERIDGIQYDVEPYLLSANHPYSWEKDTLTIWNKYIQNLEDWQTKVNDHNAGNDDDIRFGVAIPFWWEKSTEPSTVDHRTIQNIVDYIAIMSYNTRLDDEGRPIILDLIQDEIHYANDPDNDGSDLDALKNSVYAGLETIEVNWKEPVTESFFKYLYPHSTSFFVKTNEGMEAIIREVANTYKNESDSSKNFSSFIGTAVHYYEDSANGETAYRALQSTTTNHAPVCFIDTLSGKEKLVKNKHETIHYRAHDPDGDSLKIRISISNNGGMTWTPVKDIDALGSPMDRNDGAYVLDTSVYASGNQYKIKLEAKELSSGGLIGLDISDYNFSILDSKIDISPPVSDGVIIQTDEKVNHPTKRFLIRWTPFSDNDEVRSYFYSLEKPSLPEKAHSTRGLSGYLISDRVGHVPVYVWAIDPSGNQSRVVSTTIRLYADDDGDGVANVDDRDADGDGIDDTVEKQENTDPHSVLSYNQSRLIGFWKFDNSTLDNSVVGGQNLIVTSGTPNYVAANSDPSDKSFRLPITGTNTELSFSQDITPDSISALTVEMWLKPEEKNELTTIPLVFEGDINQGLSLILKNDANQLTLRCYNAEINGNGGFVSINFYSGLLFDGNWHHIAMSYNGHDHSIKLFLDGEQIAQKTDAKIPPALNHSKTLRFFDGSSDYDDDNGKNCNWQQKDNACINFDNSAQFENNLFTHVDAKVRYVGLIDNLKIALAAIPQQHLGFFRDTFLNFDSDGDELNDNWEILHFGHLMAGTSDDNDNDELSNLEEFKNGWDPIDPNSPVQTLFSVSGRVDYFGEQIGDTLVQIFDNELFNGDPLNSLAIKQTSVAYTFENLKTGNYFLRAFIDSNLDGIIGVDEVASLYERNPLQVNNDIFNVDLVLADPLVIPDVSPGNADGLGTISVAVTEAVRINEGDSVVFTVAPVVGVKPYHYTWFIDDKLIAGEQMSEFTFSPDFKTIKHPAESIDLTLKCIVSDSSRRSTAEASWEHIQVHDIDRPATSPKITFTPTTPTTTDPVTVMISEPSTDLDGDAIVDYDITWELSGTGIRVSGDKLPPSQTKKGNVWEVEVRPITQPFEDGRMVISDPTTDRVVIMNSPPIAKSPSALALLNNDALKIQLEGKDPDVNDGVDDLMFSIASDPTKGTLSSIDLDTGKVEYQPYSQFDGMDSFTFTVHDGESFSEPALVTIKLNGWRFHIDVTNGSVDQLSIGQSENASNGIDKNLDLLSPPRISEISFITVYPPNGSENPLTRDIRSLSDYALWILEVESSEGTADVILNWNIDDVPKQGLFFREIKPNSDYVEDIGFDMSEVSQMIVEGGRAKRYAVIYGELEFELGLHYGWNLVSFPITPRHTKLDETLNSLLSGWIWGWTGLRYEQSKGIRARKGYWIFGVEDETTVTISGDTIINHTIGLSEGWNLIGPCSGPPYKPMLYHQVLYPEDAILLPIWQWNKSTYRESAYLIPGTGYWVYTKKKEEIINVN